MNWLQSETLQFIASPTLAHAPTTKTEIITDPVDAAPMKILLSEKGPVIYGVGQNGVDDDGAIDDDSDAGIAP